MIAVVLITKNEESNIAECLRTAVWADEIIVVDAESTDGTVSIAKTYTDRVFVRPWPGFGPQKNFGMDQASAEWIFILDADERISPELKAEIQKMLKEWTPEQPVAYRVPRRNNFYGQWVRWGGVYPDYQVRLVQNQKARYNNVQLHENLIVNGAIGTLQGHLDHFTARRLTDSFQKLYLYSSLGAEEKKKKRRTVRPHDLAFRHVVTFLKIYVLKKGFRDGVPGAIVAAFTAMYTFVKYAKLWEQVSRRTDT